MRNFIFLLFLSIHSFAQKAYDVCIYGGTSAGVIAAYTAKMYGKSVILINSTNHLGGLTSGGLGQTDIGNKYAISGLSREFYRKIGKHYDKFEKWTFEPHVAENIFNDFIKKGLIQVVNNQYVKSVIKEKGIIKEVVFESTTTPALLNKIQAKVFIDCSYEGDLMAQAGVSYTVGREANSTYDETWNGVQLLDKHQFPDGIDPYKITGNTESGLLWGVSPEKVATKGSGDKKVQAYNFRLCLTDSVANQIPITKPADYDASKYELLLRYIEKAQPKELNWVLMHIQSMPHHKTDINNSGPFSTDMIGENYDYPNANYTTRKNILKKHESYTKGLLYFLGNDERVPQHLRSEMKKYGYPKDEYIDNQHFSPQMYVREARRMIGEYVMTQKHCEGQEVVHDGVGMAAYTMDSHNCQRVVVADKNGKPQVKNEGDVQIGGGLPYPISYHSLTPKIAECQNLLVPVCLSASHIAYGSIRMEPVFMVLGQSCGVAASLAIDEKKSVQQINIKTLQEELKNNPLADKSIPEILIDNDDEKQRVVKGEWQVFAEGSGRYGKDYFLSENNARGLKSVTYKPNLQQNGNYKVYIYQPYHERLTSKLELKLNMGGYEKIIEVSPKKEESDWLYIGSFLLKKEDENTLEITTQHADGVVIADAVLFVPER